MKPVLAALRKEARLVGRVARTFLIHADSPPDHLVKQPPAGPSTRKQPNAQRTCKNGESQAAGATQRPRHDEEWLEQTMPVLQALVTHLDTLIRGTIPDLQYGVKWKNAYYALHGRGWIIETVAYEVSVNLVFFAGAKFDAEPPRARARATSISARSRKPKHRRSATGSIRRQSIQAGGQPTPVAPQKPLSQWV